MKVSLKQNNISALFGLNNAQFSLFDIYLICSKAKNARSLFII